MPYWILQANPARYHLADALADPGSIRYWTIVRYKGDIALRDQFALWVAGRLGGVQAFGHVTGRPELVPDDDPNWADPAEGERLAWRIGVKIDDVLSERIPRTDLASDPHFADAAIIRMARGGNPFPVTESQWAAIRSWRAQDVAAAPQGSGPGRGDYASNDDRRSPLRWTREEDILALHLFVSAGVVDGGPFLGKDDPRVVALSQRLRSMPTHPGVPRDEKFRNPSGVELKLMNFRAVERAVKQDLGVPGAAELPRGMPRYAALDKAIFEEYFSKSFDGLADDAEAIGAAAAAHPASVTTVTAEDRPIEDASTASYEAAGAEGGTRSRSEHALVLRYADWLAKRGVKVVSRLYRVPGLARPFCCDAFLPERSALIEAKSSDGRDAIRMAIGQLLDYQYLEGRKLQLAVLLPHEPNAEVRTLLDHVGIASIWPSGDGFRDSAGGVLTRTSKS